MIVELTHKYAGQFVSFDVTLSMAFSWKARPSAHVRETVSGPRPGIHTVKVWCDNSERERVGLKVCGDTYWITLAVVFSPFAI